MTIEFQETTNVPADTLSTVLSFTNSVSKIYLNSIIVNSNLRAEWFIYVNTVLLMKRRSNDDIGSYNIDMHKFIMSDNDILDVKVKHYEPTTHDFQTEVNYE